MFRICRPNALGRAGVWSPTPLTIPSRFYTNLSQIQNNLAYLLQPVATERLPLTTFSPAGELAAGRDLAERELERGGAERAARLAAGESAIAPDTKYMPKIQKCTNIHTIIDVIEQMNIRRISDEYQMNIST